MSVDTNAPLNRTSRVGRPGPRGRAVAATLSLALIGGVGLVEAGSASARPPAPGVACATKAALVQQAEQQGDIYDFFMNAFYSDVESDHYLQAVTDLARANTALQRGQDLLDQAQSAC